MLRFVFLAAARKNKMSVLFLSYNKIQIYSRNLEVLEMVAAAEAAAVMM